MDRCSGATLGNITTAFPNGSLLRETLMSDICAMNDTGFTAFEDAYYKMAVLGGGQISSLMPVVTLFCFVECDYYCPAYFYSVSHDSELVKERLSVFMPPLHYSYAFIVPFVLLIGIILLIGTLGNLLTIVVITRNNVLQASSHYLVSLAFSDLLLLALTGPTEIASDLHYWPWSYTRPLCRLRYYLIEACAFTTVLHIVTFTLERYLVICHPIRARSLISASRAKRIIAAIWVVSFLTAFPIFLAYDVLQGCEGIPESRICEVKNDAWEGRVQKFYIFSSIILFFIPMVLITVLYSLVARVLFGHNNKVPMRRSSSVAKRGRRPTKDKHDDGVERSRKRVVKILALIAVSFFACWFPFHTIRLMPHFGAEYWSEWFTEVLYHKWLYHASIFLLYISSAINPVLYNLMSKRFRRAVRTTLCCQPVGYRHTSVGPRQGSTRVTSPGTSV